MAKDRVGKISNKTESIEESFAQTARSIRDRIKGMYQDPLFVKYIKLEPLMPRCFQIVEKKKSKILKFIPVRWEKRINTIYARFQYNPDTGETCIVYGVHDRRVESIVDEEVEKLAKKIRCGPFWSRSVRRHYAHSDNIEQ